MSTVLQRLLKHPHPAVFDTSPVSEVALRIRNPHGLTWRVTDGVLHLVTGLDIDWDGSLKFYGHYNFGITLRDYVLAGKSIRVLAEEVRADGHEVVFENAAVGGLDAMALMAASGDQALSNGDRVNAFTSLLWCVFSAQGLELQESERQVGQALRQMVLQQAEGEWLDLWGTLYGVPRLAGESDAALRLRIPREVFRLRVNGLSIEQAVADLTGAAVTLYEPWRDVFRLSASRLSGAHHLADGEFWTYHVIQPVVQEGADLAAILPVVERNKPAGVRAHAPRIVFRPRRVSMLDDFLPAMQRGDLRPRTVNMSSTQVLGVLRLNAAEGEVRAHRAIRFDRALPGREMLFDSAVIHDGSNRFDGILRY